MIDIIFIDSIFIYVVFINKLMFDAFTRVFFYLFLPYFCTKNNCCKIYKIYLHVLHF